MARLRWSSRMVFLFAAIGSAVGLGNLWRFPYLTYKFGGGAFLIPYLLALFLIGIPILMLEFAIGQKFQQGAIGAFSQVGKKLKGIGAAAIYSGAVVVVYYSAVIAWSIVYLIRSFETPLPWAGQAKDFFFGTVLQITDGIGTIGGMNWGLFVALALVWIIVYFCIFKGVDSVGKVVTITMPLPLILLFVLLIRGLTLDGAMTGIYYYLKPDFSALLSADVWLAAISQIFFTLSVAFGIMIAYASFNGKKENIVGNTFTTALTNSAISLFAGFVVFSVLGYMATSTGVGIDEVATGGPGLAFVVFPEALSLMPWASFFSVLFFITLLTLGIDSAFSLVESVDTALMDKHPKMKKHHISMITCALGFVLGILFVTDAGLYFLDVFDHFITNFGLVIVGILECIAIGWIFGADKLRKYINSTSKTKIGPWWSYSIKYIIPAALIFFVVAQFITEISANYEGYPDWAISIGWVIVVIPLLFVAKGMLSNPKKA